MHTFIKMNRYVRCIATTRPLTFVDVRFCMKHLWHFNDYFFDNTIIKLVHVLYKSLINITHLVSYLNFHCIGMKIHSHPWRNRNQ